MIKHILKIMKTESKSNSWIMLELLLVFVVMWFCYDYLNLMIKRYNEPKGFDINHTYLLEFGLKDEYKEKLNRIYGNKDSLLILYANDGARILERIKQLPYIENACFAESGMPYGNSESQYSFMIDSVQTGIILRNVSPEYFDVFKIDVKKYPWYNWDNHAANQTLLSSDQNGNIAEKPIEDMKEIIMSGDRYLQIAGIANKIKKVDFGIYTPISFLPIKQEMTIPIPSLSVDLAIRVKPDADEDFAYKFKNDVQDKLDIGPYYFVHIKPLEKQREITLIAYGYTENIRNVAFVIAFIIINVFLGVFGTFWFRTQSRQSEIGLRCAIGSSKKQINWLIMGESLIMLFIVSIPGTIIALFFSYFEIINELGIPSVNHAQNNLGLSHYVSNYVVTMLVLSLIIIIGTYFPSKKAMSIQPSQALRAE